jgi:integrase
MCTKSIADKDLHFHDLHGTAATKFYIAGLSIRVIAEILAWSEDQVERIIRRYVARAAATGLTAFLYQRKRDFCIDWSASDIWTDLDEAFRHG